MRDDSWTWYHLFIFCGMVYGGMCCASIGWFLGYILAIVNSGVDTPVHFLKYYLYEWFEDDSFNALDFFNDCREFMKVHFFPS